MKLQNDNEDEYRGISVKMPTVILVASAAIFAVLAIVVAANGTGNRKHTTQTQSTLEPAADQSAVDTGEDTETEDEEDKLTASDLDFWDMYQDSDEADEEAAETTRKDELEGREAEMKDGGDVIPDGGGEEDVSTDGKHTKVVYSDGTTEWVAINSSIKLNDFDDTLFQSQNGIITYTSGGRKISQIGADISQYTTSVDWDQLATEVDYVMIRAGARGYDTGKIIADTKFTEYVNAAVEHDIPFGVYFSSQAISVDEAKEEAKYVTGQLQTIRDAINAAAQNSENKTKVTPGTTVSTDGQGNVVTTTIDENGNSTITVTDSSNKTLTVTTVTSDAYGNTSTVVKDGDGNVKSTKLEQTDLTTGVITVTTTTYNSDGTVTTQTDTTQPASGTTTQTTDTTTKHEFQLNYPIAVDMHFIENDTARIERISKTEKTNILAAFCDEIEKSGYNSMIYANKEFLICELNQTALTNYDTWLLNEGTLPDYPYMLSMWKYAESGSRLKSLSGDYGVDVGFIDYSLR